MIVHEFDLSPLPGQPAGPERPAPTAGQQSPAPRPAGGISRWITLLALGLLGVAAGAVLGSAPAGASHPAPVPATLAMADVLPDGDRPLIMLRLSVQSPGGPASAPARVNLAGARLELEGPGRVAIQLTDPITTGDLAVIDVQVRPDCSQQQPDQKQPLRARVVTPGSPSGVQVLVAGPLSGPGGLCGLADSVLPAGWRTAIAAEDPRIDGDDLVLTVPGLRGIDVSGLVPAGGVLQTSAQIGDWLLPATVTNDTVLRILGPPPCSAGTTGQDGNGLPMSARLLVRQDSALHQLVITAGPALAGWLVADCPGNVVPLGAQPVTTRQ
jgi:hypothetical protein